MTSITLSRVTDWIALGDRWRELETRAALGATRMRILSQALIENLLLWSGQETFDRAGSSVQLKR